MNIFNCDAAVKSKHNLKNKNLFGFNGYPSVGVFTLVASKCSVCVSSIYVFSELKAYILK